MSRSYSGSRQAPGLVVISSLVGTVSLMTSIPPEPDLRDEALMAKARAIVASERASVSKKYASVLPSRRLLTAVALFCIALLVIPLFIKPSAVRAPAAQESGLVYIWASAIDGRADSAGVSPREVVLSSNLSSLVELYAKASGKRPSLDTLTGDESSLRVSPVFDSSKVSLHINRLRDGRMSFSFRPGTTYCLTPGPSIGKASTVVPRPCE